MAKFKIKFFGNKKERDQIRLVKTFIEADKREDVEIILKKKYGYKVINGLKIHNYEE